MAFIAPGPGQRWCPCCELLFVPAQDNQKMCREAACLARRHNWRSAIDRRKAAERSQREADLAAGLICPKCGKRDGKHTANCRLAQLAAPCYICGRMFDEKLQLPNPDAITREHRVPRSYSREHGRIRGFSVNVVLAHSRCNTWKGDRLPRDVKMFQPPWGVRPGVFVATAKQLPPATKGPVLHPLSARTSRRPGQPL